MRIKKSVIYLVLFLLLISCEKDVLIPQYNGFADNYLKLRLNTTWLFEVDSIYRETDRPEIIKRYYEKHVVVDSLLEGDQLTYNVTVLRSNDTFTEFKSFRAYSLVLTNHKVELFSQGTSFVMLTAPLELNKQWENKHTNCNYKFSKITGVNEFWEWNGKPYSNVLNVNHCDFYVFDRNQGHSAIYAKDVGAVHEQAYYGSYNRLARCRKLHLTTRTLMTYAY
jgi:hypothetical protein